MLRNHKLRTGTSSIKRPPRAPTMLKHKYKYKDAQTVEHT
jgi:hypothetical protein